MCPTGDCSCSRLCEAILPGPVGGIVEVLLDGVALPPTAYRVDNGNRLVRTDGDCWPACQDMAAPPTFQYEPLTFTGPAGTFTITRVGQIVTITATTSTTGVIDTLGTTPWPPRGLTEADGSRSTLVAQPDGGVRLWNAAAPVVETLSMIYETAAAATAPDPTGTFAVRYYQGFAPDAMISYAAGVLANEFLKACEGKKCRLPAGVSRVTRQGVTYEITAGSFPGGFTGIQEVDTVIRLFNPGGLTQAPVVSSPDIRRPRTPTWGQW